MGSREGVIPADDLRFEERARKRAGEGSRSREEGRRLAEKKLVTGKASIRNLREAGTTDGRRLTVTDITMVQTRCFFT
jgi:hypothetical protein